MDNPRITFACLVLVLLVHYSYGAVGLDYAYGNPYGGLSSGYGSLGGFSLAGHGHGGYGHGSLGDALGHGLAAGISGYGHLGGGGDHHGGGTHGVKLNVIDTYVNTSLLCSAQGGVCLSTDLTSCSGFIKFECENSALCCFNVSKQASHIILANVAAGGYGNSHGGGGGYGNSQANSYQGHQTNGGYQGNSQSYAGSGSQTHSTGTTQGYGGGIQQQGYGGGNQGYGGGNQGYGSYGGILAALGFGLGGHGAGGGFGGLSFDYLTGKKRRKRGALGGNGEKDAVELESGGSEEDVVDVETKAEDVGLDQTKRRKPEGKESTHVEGEVLGHKGGRGSTVHNANSHDDESKKMQLLRLMANGGNTHTTEEGSHVNTPWKIKPVSRVDRKPTGMNNKIIARIKELLLARKRHQ